MGRAPCCDEVGLKKGPWTPEEDRKLTDYIQEKGHGSWRALPKLAGLNRCGKSCRLRWTNYLRPDIKRGRFSEDEEQQIIHLHSVLGNKWSAIAVRLPGRTDNEIKNYWNTHLRKKLLHMGIDPVTHRPRADLALLASLPTLLAAANLQGSLGNAYDSINALRLQADAAKLKLVENIFQVLTAGSAAGTAGSDYGSSDNHQLGDHLSDQLYDDGSLLGLIQINPNQIVSSTFPNLGMISTDHLPPFNNLPEPCMGGKEVVDPQFGVCSFPDGFSSERGSSCHLLHTCSNLTSNSTPSLASDSSPDHTMAVSDMQEALQMAPDNMQAPAAPSMSEPWGDLSLMEDLSREFYCGQSVLEDTFSSTWPATS